MARVPDEFIEYHPLYTYPSPTNSLYLGGAVPPSTRKTAAKKTAAPRSPKLTVKRSSPAPTKPKMIPAEKIAEIYTKAATDNQWCDNGRTSVAALLRNAGIDVTAASSRAALIPIGVHANADAMELNSASYIRQNVWKAATKLLMEELKSKYPHGIEIEVPIGTGTRTGKLTIDFNHALFYDATLRHHNYFTPIS